MKAWGIICCIVAGCWNSGAYAAIEKIENAAVRVAFDLADGTYAVTDKQAGLVCIRGAHAEVGEWSTADAAYARTAQIEKTADELGTAQTLAVTCAAEGKPTLLLEFRIYENAPQVVVRGGWKNTGAEAFCVKRFRPMAGGVAFEGGDWREVRTLTSQSGGNEPHVSHASRAESANDLLLTLKRDGVRRSLVLGALKTSEFTKWAATRPGGAERRCAELAKALPGCRLASYLDCGATDENDTRKTAGSALSITLAQGKPYVFHSDAAAEPLATVVFDDKAVRFGVGGLNPANRYVLGFSWWDANGDHRRGRVTATGKNGQTAVLADSLALPSQEGPSEYAFLLPSDVCADGCLELTFANNTNAPNMVVSEVWLWEKEGKADVRPTWSAEGRAVCENSGENDAAEPLLEARDPVGRRTDPGETCMPEDSFYVDVVTADPFEALERYAWQLRKATHAAPNLYDFPTVCAWYAGVWHTRGAQNHPEKSTYQINTSAGLVGEANEIRKCGFLHYARAAVRLVPDNYTPENPQGWWDDEHWRLHGLYTQPCETSAKLGAAMHAQGCLAFTYIQPTTWNTNVGLCHAFCAAHPDWLIGGDPNRCLDLSKPAVQDYMRSRFAALRGNIDGLMVDYCDELWHRQLSAGGFADPKRTAAACYRLFFEMIREGIGPQARIHERCIGNPNNDLLLGIVDSQRTSGDTDKISPGLVSRSGLRWYKNRVVLSYDMDSKELTTGWKDKDWKGTDRDGRRMLLTMAYVAASRLLTANSFRDLSVETLHDLSRTFPYPTEPACSARPVDAFVCDGCPRVYNLAVAPGWHQLTLFNTARPCRETTFAVPLSGEPVSGALGLDPTKTYYVYDFWNDCLAAKLRGSDVLVQDLRPGEARMLSVHEAKAVPQFIATDRHVMQGALDLVVRPVWNGQTKTLSGTSRVAAGDPYRVILACNGYAPVSAAAHGGSVALGGIDERTGLTALTLRSADQDRDVVWSVAFKTDE